MFHISLSVTIFFKKALFDENVTTNCGGVFDMVKYENKRILCVAFTSY